MWIFKRTFNWKNILVPVVDVLNGASGPRDNKCQWWPFRLAIFLVILIFPFLEKVIQVANPNRAQFTKCASYAIPSTTNVTGSYTEDEPILFPSLHLTLELAIVPK